MCVRVYMYCVCSNLQYKDVILMRMFDLVPTVVQDDQQRAMLELPVASTLPPAAWTREWPRLGANATEPQNPGMEDTQTLSLSLYDASMCHANFRYR